MTVNEIPVPDVAGGDLAVRDAELTDREPDAETREVAINLPALNFEVHPDSNGLPVVGLAVTTAFGTLVYPVEAALARRVGVLLQDAGSKAASGIVTPSSRLIVPGR